MCAGSRPFHVGRAYASDICLASEQQRHFAVCVVLRWVLIAFFILFSCSFFPPLSFFFSPFLSFCGTSKIFSTILYRRRVCPI